MKIEEGRQYQTRSGDRVEILNVHSSMITGRFISGSPEGSVFWLPDGRFAPSDIGEHPYDLIAEVEKEEKRIMKIEEGKRYRTRNGFEADIHKIYAGSYRFPITGALFDPKHPLQGDACTWTLDGRFSDQTIHHPFDLVAEIETEMLEAWLSEGPLDGVYSIRLVTPEGEKLLPSAKRRLPQFDIKLS